MSVTIAIFAAFLIFLDGFFLFTLGPLLFGAGPQGKQHLAGAGGCLLGEKGFPAERQKLD